MMRTLRSLVTNVVALSLLVFHYLFVAPCLLSDKVARNLLFMLVVPSQAFETLRCGELASSAAPGSSSTAAVQLTSFLIQRKQNWSRIWYDELPLSVVLALSAFFFAMRLPLIGGFIERASVNCISASVLLTRKNAAPKVRRVNKNNGLLFLQGDDINRAEPPVVEKRDKNSTGSPLSTPEILPPNAAPAAASASPEDDADSPLLLSCTGRRAASSSASPAGPGAASPQATAVLTMTDDEDDTADDVQFSSPCSTRVELAVTPEPRLGTEEQGQEDGEGSAIRRSLSQDSGATREGEETSKKRPAKNTVIWVDATACRSAIPLWHSKLWAASAASGTSGNKEVIIEHCQLVSLREADAPDAAELLPATPSSPENFTAVFPAMLNKNDKKKDADSSAVHQHVAAVGDQSSRVLTEALAEGVVSAWAHVAEDGSRVSFACCGYEAAAAVLLAATSSSDKMKAALDSVVFFDSISFNNAAVGEAPFSSLSQTRDGGLLEELWRALAVPIEALEAAPPPLPPPPRRESLSSASLYSIPSSRSPTGKSALKSTKNTVESLGGASPGSNGSGGNKRRPVFRVPSMHDWTTLLDTDGTSGRTTPGSGTGTGGPTPPNSPQLDDDDDDDDDRDAKDGESAVDLCTSQLLVKAASGLDRSGIIGDTSVDELLSHESGSTNKKTKSKFEFSAAAKNAHSTDSLFRNDMTSVAARVSRSLRASAVKFLFVSSCGRTRSADGASSTAGSTVLATDRCVQLFCTAATGGAHQSPSSSFLASWVSSHVASRNGMPHQHHQHHHHHQKSKNHMMVLLELAGGGRGDGAVTRPQPDDAALLFSKIFWNRPDAPLPIRCVRGVHSLVTTIRAAVSVDGKREEKIAMETSVNNNDNSNFAVSDLVEKFLQVV